MAIQHRDIPDAQLHEPKGVASAASGHVYTADGSGSGDWQFPLLQGQGAAGAYKMPVLDESGQVQWIFWPFGYGYYKHSGSGQTIGTSFTNPLIDGLSGDTFTDKLPPEIRGSGDLWDAVRQRLTPITEGDSYVIRLDLPILSESGNPTEIALQLDIGSGTAPTIPITTSFEAVGKNTPYTLTFSYPIFSRGTFLANDGQFFLKTDVGSVTLGSPAVTIVRVGTGEI